MEFPVPVPATRENCPYLDELKDGEEPCTSHSCRLGIYPPLLLDCPYLRVRLSLDEANKMLEAQQCCGWRDPLHDHHDGCPSEYQVECENRELKEENEKLKKEIALLKAIEAASRMIHEWNLYPSYMDSSDSECVQSLDDALVRYQEYVAKRDAKKVEEEE